MPANLDDAQEQFTRATFGRAHLKSVDAACTAILKENVAAQMEAFTSATILVSINFLLV